MRLVGCRAEAGPSVSLILGVVSVEPDDIAVALEGDYVCRDPVEKPPVVTYHYGTPREILESVFQRTHGVNVEVICRLVEQNYIGALFQNSCQVNPITLASREQTDFLLLICSLKN